MLYCRFDCFTQKPYSDTLTSNKFQSQYCRPTVNLVSISQ